MSGNQLTVGYTSVAGLSHVVKVWRACSANGARSRVLTGGPSACNCDAGALPARPVRLASSLLRITDSWNVVRSLTLIGTTDGMGSGPAESPPQQIGLFSVLT